MVLLKDCVQEVKEPMKQEVFTGAAGNFTARMWIRIIKAAALVNKQVTMTLIVNETRNPINQVIKKI